MLIHHVPKTPVDWYAYITGPSDAIPDCPIDAGEMYVVGSGLDDSGKTIYEELAEIAEQMDIRSKPIYFHVVEVGPREMEGYSGWPVTIYRARKIKGQYEVKFRDGDSWVQY